MEVSPKCGEISPTGKSVGVSEVEKEDIEKPIPGQRETKRESPGRHDYAGSNYDGKQSKTDGTEQRQRGDGLQKRVEAAAPWSIRGRCVCRAGDRWCQCAGVLARLETRDAAGISLEIYSGERKDAKVAATVSALARRSVLISLVPSVTEADVATVDGLESTIKSARDQKRWKLAAI
ncbi:hypothetical protein BHM03_00003517 [Ensete ventricosum]|nr:hypothetical protein BHM03_00003517 [Ensete ventricosum]